MDVCLLCDTPVTFWASIILPSEPTDPPPIFHIECVAVLIRRELAQKQAMSSMTEPRP